MAQTDRATGLVGETGIKEPVRVATTANITLSGEQTIDGVAVVDGDRVLVKDQTTAANSGIYEVDTSTWSRTKDCNGAYDLVNGTLVYVRSGTTNGNKIFKCTAIAPITIGTTSLTFVAMDIEISGQARFVWCGTATGTANALTLTPSVAVTTLTAGLTLLFKSGSSANSGATTIAVSSLTATAVQSNGSAMVGGEIEANKWYLATYEGTAFQILKYAPALMITGGTMTGDITMSGSSIFDANASIAAHATTMDPWSLGNYGTLTGAAVTFTALTAAPQAGAEVELYMNAAHVFTDGAVFEVDGDQNYTATIGDRVLLRAKSTTVFTVHPRKKDGTAVVATAVSIKIGTFTRDTSLATGSQAVTGVGFTPKGVIFFAVQDNSAEASWGFDNVTGSYGIGRRQAGTNLDVSSASIYDSEGAGVSYTGVLASLDADGFTVSWTRNGAPTGTLTIQYMAIR